MDDEMAPTATANPSPTDPVRTGYLYHPKGDWNPAGAGPGTYDPHWEPDPAAPYINPPVEVEVIPYGARVRLVHSFATPRLTGTVVTGGFHRVAVQVDGIQTTDGRPVIWDGFEPESLEVIG